MKKFWVLLIIVAMFLVGCNFSKSTIPEVETNVSQENQDNAVSLDQIINDPHILALRQGDRMLMVDPELPAHSEVYKLSLAEIPLGNELFEFKLSYDHKWVVWYAPQTGLILLDVVQKKTQVIEPQSDWLNRHAYVEMADRDNLVYWISGEGKVLNELNMVTKDKKEIPIPYPFGNAFRVSPDQQRIVYITGFDQDTTRPRFMFSNRGGTYLKTFASKVELSDRFTVEWMPDNSGIVTILNGRVNFFSYQKPGDGEVRFESISSEVQDIRRRGKDLYVYEKEGYWHKFDLETQKETARIPTDIADELKRPVFYPWDNQKFLVTENSVNDDAKFFRLWLSSYRGQKNLVLSSFGETQAATFSGELD